MSDHRPPPLTPARSDLTDFGWMPLDIIRFRGSDLIAEAEPEAALAAIMLWTAAWHQVPAASLTNTDRALAKAAGYGRAVDAWLKVKDQALHGFVECSDGRLYHSVVAEKAREAWKGKVEQRYRTECGRIKKHNERHPERQLAVPTFDAFAAHYPDNCPGDTRALSQGQLGLVPDDIASKGKGEGDSIEQQPPTPAEPPKVAEPEADYWASDLPTIADELCRIAGVPNTQPSAIARNLDVARGWQKAGVDFATAGKLLKDWTADNPEQSVSSLRYFDARVLKTVAVAKAGGGTKPKPIPPAKPIDDRDDDDPRLVAIRTDLRRRLGARTYDGWVGPDKTALHVNGVGLVIKAATEFNRSWIETHFSEDWKAVAKLHGIEGIKVTK